MRCLAGPGARRDAGPARAIVVHRLSIGTRLPGRSGEVVGRQFGWRRQRAAGVQHALDVLVEGEDDPIGVDGVKPLGLPVEQEQHHVGERAGPEAPPDGEVHDIAQAPALPLPVEEVGGHGGEAVLGAAAAAPARAHEEVPARTRDVDEAPVGTDDEVAPPLVHPRRPQPRGDSWTSATPISASRVMRGSNSASLIRSEPTGRWGSTM